MRVVTVVGARPQFIKAAALSRAIAADGNITEKILHTGQHYDEEMSAVFFEELEIPRPSFNLGISALSHGAMTGRMLESIECVLRDENPDWVLVYGDTNSTLAGALAAVKLQIPVAHVEAGLRSFNWGMPEEVNRTLADRVSRLLLCPTEAAVRNLATEGMTAGVHLVGDVMFDLALQLTEVAKVRYRLDEWRVEARGYTLCTIHRQENTHDADRLRGILLALRVIAVETPLILPLHPGTAKRIDALGDLGALGRIRTVPPLSYLKMTRLLAGAETVLTDSGGVQKEAAFHGVPCVTLRDETEWGETVSGGWNLLVGANPDLILEGWRRMRKGPARPQITAYGDGHAAARIVRLLSAGP